jgi:sterol 3beta-glucosyltransferase
MRIAVVAAGSRGDAEPFLALSLALQARGHSPVFLGHEQFRAAAHAVDVPFRVMAGDPRQMLASRTGLELMSARSPMQVLGHLQELGRDLFAEAAVALERELLDCDAVVFSTLAVAAYHVAEKYQMPRMWGVLQPVTPTREWPSLLLPYNFGRLGNRASYRVADLLTWATFGPATQQYRRAAGLAELPNRQLRQQVATTLPVLGGWSPQLVPRPDDWPAHVQVTGSWHLDHHEPLAEEIEQFLATGDPPVYLGLGSATVADPQEVTDMFVRAARLAGARLIISSGWAGLGAGSSAVDEASDEVMVIGDTPHAELFPRCAAVGHHCGAGTTHAAVRAGVVTIPLPMWGDQPFWAQQLFRRGVAVAPVPQHTWSVQSLAQGIAAAIGEPHTRRRAQEFAYRCTQEDGAEKAAALVDRRLVARSSP